MAEGTGPDVHDERQSTLLKELLRQRHWQTYRRFRTEYDKVASSLDKELVGTYPSESTYKRWLSGRIRGVPRSEPCAVLEAMFPGYSIEELFEFYRDDVADASTRKFPSADGPPIPSPSDPNTTEPAAPITADAYPGPHRIIADVGEVVIVAIDRRTFLAGSGAGLLIGGRVEPVDSSRQVSPEIVEHLAGQIDGYYAAEAALGPHTIIPSVLVQQEILHQFLLMARDGTRRALLRLNAAYGGLITWLYQDAGDMETASRWANQTLEMAHRVGDTQLIRHALTNKAMICTDQRDGPGTLDLTGAALADEKTLCAKVRVQAMQQAAHGCALMGDRRGVDSALDKAAALLSNVDDDYPWFNACLRTPGYIEAQRATCYNRLGLGAEAVVLWDQVISGLPPAARRDAGVYRARQAMACVQTNQPDRALEAVGQAVALAHETRSARLRQELEGIWPYLAPWRDDHVGHEVKELLAQL